jgi:hypothetical protein
VLLAIVRGGDAQTMPSPVAGALNRNGSG